MKKLIFVLCLFSLSLQAQNKESYYISGGLGSRVIQYYSTNITSVGNDKLVYNFGQGIHAEIGKQFVNKLKVGIHYSWQITKVAVASQSIQLLSTDKYPNPGIYFSFHQFGLQFQYPITTFGKWSFNATSALEMMAIDWRSPYKDDTGIGSAFSKSSPKKKIDYFIRPDAIHSGNFILGAGIITNYKVSPKVSLYLKTQMDQALKPFISCLTTITTEDKRTETISTVSQGNGYDLSFGMVYLLR